MSNTKGESPKPDRIEVWLTKVSDLRITAKEVHEDESVEEWNDGFISSLSIRGAEREVTGYLLSEGYEPVGRWESEAVSRDRVEEVEASRVFQLKKAKTASKTRS